LMEAKGLTFRELSKLARVGQHQIHYAREGEFKRLNFKTLEKIAKALCVNYCDLFDELEDRR
jgi:DNA-binding Xre family transcriptional regulator